MYSLWKTKLQRTFNFKIYLSLIDEEALEIHNHLHQLANHHLKSFILEFLQLPILFQHNIKHHVSIDITATLACFGIGVHAKPW